MVPSTRPPAAARVRLLQVEPTTRCNFTCGFCVGRHLDQSDMTLETFRRALEQLPDLERLEIHGEGEPLMHPDFFEMARMARDRGIKVSTITNGSMFSPERINRILEIGLETIFVSIESPRADDFEEIRGGRLPKVVKGIRALLAARAARQQANPTVGFAVTVLKRTQGLELEIARLYAELGMDGGISAHMLNTMPSYTGHYSASMVDQVLSRAEQALAWTRYANIVRSPTFQPSAAAVHFSDEVFGQNDPGKKTASTRTRLARDYRSCPWLDEGLYVNRHGQATGCARIKDTARFGFGDIRRDPLDSVLSRRARLAESLRAGLTPDPCAGCFIADAIESRIGRLRGRRPVSVSDMVAPAEWDRAMDGDAIGSIPYDEGAVRAICDLADGTRTTEALLAALGRVWLLDPAATATRVLPVLNELVRMKAIVLDR
jgi:MoaA/NifB/PqqE/SkfB family radical SAM enzyme